MLRRLEKFLFRRRDVCTLFFGLHYSGKSAILHKLKHGDLLLFTTSMGPSTQVETIHYKNDDFTVWDLPSCLKFVKFRALPRAWHAISGQHCQRARASNLS